MFSKRTTRDSLPAASHVPVSLWVAALVFALALTIANIIFGNLNQDEGWYLLAARRVAQGKLPYRDFMFTQGPMMPWLYGLFHRLWAPLGLLGGRIFTALPGLAASGMALLLARRLAPPRSAASAGFTAWLLVACVPVHSYFVAIPKTYALAALLLLAGFTALAHPGGGRRVAFAVGILLGLAAATRISLILALPVVGLILVWQRHEPTWRRAWPAYTLGAALALILTVGLSWLFGGKAFIFSQFYHVTRAHDSCFGWLSLRVGFVSRTIQAYPLLWVLAICLGSLAMASRNRLTRLDNQPVALAMLLTLLAVSLLHVLAPFPYDDYQTPLMPLLAALTAAVLWQSLDSATSTVKRAAPALLAIATLLLACASPLLMDWIVIRQDRFWFERKSQPDILRLREAARQVRGMYQDDEPRLLLTQDAYLAVEAGCDVPAGLEMGPFSIFPALDNPAVRLLHLHNPATLAELIADGTAPVAATSGYSFALACPETSPLSPATREELYATLEKYYEPQHEIADFGQGHTTLTLWQKRK